MPRISKTGRLFFYLVIPVLFLAEAAYLVGCNQEKAKKDSFVQVDNDPSFLGSESCKSCHESAYEDWTESHHDKAMMVANDSSVLGDFNNVTFENQGVKSRFFRDGEKFMVNTEGPDGQSHDYEIIYTFGIHPLQQYIVAFPNGHYQCLRTAWDCLENKWFDLYPDLKISTKEWLHWTKGGLSWNTMCSDCHSTNVKKNYDEKTHSFNTTFSIINVSCEACHGAGKEHVEYVTSPSFNKNDPYKASDHLHLTSSLTSKEQVEDCARCHSRRMHYVNAFENGDNFRDDYFPEILRDELYFADGQIMDEDYVYSSFVSSKMYHNDVKCSNCHNPHSLELKFQGNMVCSQCHVPADYDTPDHHFHPIETESAQCVNCHMTGQVYMGNDFRRDHSFRVPRPDQSVEFGTPNACTGCHQDQSDEWAAKKVVEWYGEERAPHFSDALTKGSTRSPEAVKDLLALLNDKAQPEIARATAVHYLNQISDTSAMNAVIKSLDDEASYVRHTAIHSMYDWPQDLRFEHLPKLLSDSLRSVRVSAMGGLLELPIDQVSPVLKNQIEKVMPEYKNMLNVRADFAPGRMSIGQFHDRQGRLAEAEAAYKKAIELDELFNPARINLSHLYNRQGRNEEAMAMLKEVIKQEPNYGPAYYSMGLLLAEMKRLEQAAGFLGRGAELVGNNPRIYYNWGLSLQQLGRNADAEKAFIGGLEIDPNSPDLNYAIAGLYLQIKKNKEAEKYIKKLIEMYPEQPQFQQMLDAAQQ